MINNKLRQRMFLHCFNSSI